MNAANAYAVDGLCHNSEPGTHGQECGSPATWLGARVGLIRGAQPFVMGFCDACKKHGAEAAGMGRWERIVPNTVTHRAVAAWEDFSAQADRGPAGKGGDHG